MYANKHVYQDWIQQYDANKNRLQSSAMYGNSVLQVDTCDNFIKTWSQLHETVSQVAGSWALDNVRTAAAFYSPATLSERCRKLNTKKMQDTHLLHGLHHTIVLREHKYLLI